MNFFLLYNNEFFAFIIVILFVKLGKWKSSEPNLSSTGAISVKKSLRFR